MFDGVFLDSPYALTFGPQMVEAIHKRFASEQLTLDIHLCVDRPERYVKTMVESGANRIIFQWEAFESFAEAVNFATLVTSLGISCGVSINPKTPPDVVIPLLETGLVDLVDVLAVEAGFGGQSFNPVALQKISMLRQWRKDNPSRDFSILVDGGINASTSSCAVEAGADILVAGTALFRNPLGFADAVKELL